MIILNIYTLSLIDFKEEEAPVITVQKEKTEEKIKVDVKGQIKTGGLYELDEGSRVYDLIEKAGGTTENADTSIINLSKKLKDEMVVIIYSKDEVQKLKNDSEEVKCNCPEENDACITEDQLDTFLDKKIKEKTANKSVATNNGKLSINTATSEQLQSLEGIGKAKADAIIEYRNKNGKFKSIEEITNVSGIGENALEKIKDYITT